MIRFIISIKLILLKVAQHKMNINICTGEVKYAFDKVNCKKHKREQ